MSSLHDFAKEELERINDGSIEQIEVNMDIMALVDQFSKQEHSGFSASYTLGILTKLLSFYPLTPITEDDEWQEVPEVNGSNLYQNKRYSALFKDDTGYFDTERVYCTLVSHPEFTFTGPMYYVKLPYMPKVSQKYHIILPDLFDSDEVGMPTQEQYAIYTSDPDLKKHILNKLD